MQEHKKQGTAIPPGIAAFAAYFFPFVGGLVLLAIERENRFIRFHAAQAIIFWICCIPVALISWIPVLGVIVALVFIVVWVLLMYQAWRERMFELPLLGEIARRQVFGAKEAEPPAGQSTSEPGGGDVPNPDDPRSV